MAITMKFRQYIPDHAVTTIPVLALMFAVHYFLLRDEPADPGIELTDGAPNFYQHWQWQLDEGELDIDAELNRLELDDAKRDRSIRELLQQKKYQQARTLLLEVAAAAVAQANQARFGDTLLLLGEVAINQQELAAAEIYLQEALYLSMEQDNLMGTARSYQLLGQLNIRARELARHASNTNDDLWQARNSISRGYYQGVDQNLQPVDSALRRRRRCLGGAGLVARSCARRLPGATGSHRSGETVCFDRSDDACASTDRRHRRRVDVHRLIDGIDGELISDSDLADVRREIKALFDEHQQDLIKASQARDYQMLYHHYMRKGELERAWEFRIQASEALADSAAGRRYRGTL
jgi:hypothetical protein